MDIAELSMILENLGPSVVSDEDFEKAANTVKESKNLPQDQQLLLYGLYKQYTVGDTNITEPSKLNFVAHAKWEAWKNLKGFPRHNAKIAYSYIVNNLLSEHPSLEEVEAGAPIDGFGVMISTLNTEYAAEMHWSAAEAVFKAVTENDLEALRICIAKGDSINCAHDDGMTPLHYAADRGNTAAAELLLDHGAEINAIDASLQTPLMYAVNCEYKETVRLLVSRGADMTIRNDEGETVLEFQDLSPDVANLLRQAAILKSGTAAIADVNS